MSCRPGFFVALPTGLALAALLRIHLAEGDLAGPLRAAGHAASVDSRTLDEYLPFESDSSLEVPAALVPGGAPLRLAAIAGHYNGREKLDLSEDGTWESTREGGGG